MATPVDSCRRARCSGAALFQCDDLGLRCAAVLLRDCGLCCRSVARASVVVAQDVQCIRVVDDRSCCRCFRSSVLGNLEGTRGVWSSSGSCRNELPDRVSVLVSVAKDVGRSIDYGIWLRRMGGDVSGGADAEQLHADLDSAIRDLEYLEIPGCRWHDR